MYVVTQVSVSLCVSLLGTNTYSLCTVNVPSEFLYSRVVASPGILVSHLRDAQLDSSERRSEEKVMVVSSSVGGGATDTPSDGLAMATFCLVPFTSFCHAIQKDR
ncbi:hypothetical protein EYF80_026330 [Liparis tanakae]|uniref:Uncharacterized protein n=1 Tax=Liparis tanakae TaxID=230148 RepID=A0A4Z2HD89_9TELE|nr:hypothetical protein EYF80_026330 [Liparis tanakae]